MQDIDDQFKPILPISIIKTEVVINPFSDLVGLQAKNKSKNVKEEKQNQKFKEKVAKNQNLLTFDDENEENGEDFKNQKYI